MIYEHVRATRAYPSDPFNIRSQNDDVQDLDTRWDQVLLSAGDIPAETVLVKTAGFRSASHCWLCMSKKTFEITNLQTTPD